MRVPRVSILALFLGSVLGFLGLCKEYRIHSGLEAVSACAEWGLSVVEQLDIGRASKQAEELTNLS